MTSFLDGPAIAVNLNLMACPTYLRVVWSARKGWDALDQPEDVVAPLEMVYAYKLDGKPMSGFIDGAKYKGPFFIANYRAVPNQPTEFEMRDTNFWLAWIAKQVQNK